MHQILALDPKHSSNIYSALNLQYYYYVRRLPQPIGPVPKNHEDGVLRRAVDPAAKAPTPCKDKARHQKLTRCVPPCWRSPLWGQDRASILLRVHCQSSPAPCPFQHNDSLLQIVPEKHRNSDGPMYKSLAIPHFQPLLVHISAKSGEQRPQKGSFRRNRADSLLKQLFHRIDLI